MSAGKSLIPEDILTGNSDPIASSGNDEIFVQAGNSDSGDKSEEIAIIMIHENAFAIVRFYTDKRDRVFIEKYQKLLRKMTSKPICYEKTAKKTKIP